MILILKQSNQSGKHGTFLFRQSVSDLAPLCPGMQDIIGDLGLNIMRTTILNSPSDCRAYELETLY